MMSLKNANGYLQFGLLPLCQHVQPPKPSLRPKRQNPQHKQSAERQVRQHAFHRSRSEFDDQAVYYDERDAHFGRPEPAKTDLELLGGRQQQISMEHERAKDAEHQQHVKEGSLWNQQCVTEQNRTEKSIVEQVVHVKAPLAQTRVAILAELPIKVIGEVMQHYHHVDHPHPTQIGLGEITKPNDAKRPNRS